MLVHHLTPQAAAGLIEGNGITLTTERQRDVVVRQGSMEDAELLWQMHRRLSEQTIRLRYGAPKHLYPTPVLRGQMQRMLEAEAGTSATLIGTVADGNSDAAVSLVQLVHDPADPSTAEIAIVVRDDYQREGLGRALSRLVRYVAQARGVRQLCINALAENRAIMRLIRSSGMPYTAQTMRGETTIYMPLS
jgi:RimJ/RimL family protein N-acetyltransferase